MRAGRGRPRAPAGRAGCAARGTAAASARAAVAPGAARCGESPLRSPAPTGRRTRPPAASPRRTRTRSPAPPTVAASDTRAQAAQAPATPAQRLAPPTATAAAPTRLVQQAEVGVHVVAAAPSRPPGVVGVARGAAARVGGGRKASGRGPKALTATRKAAHHAACAAPARKMGSDQPRRGRTRPAARARGRQRCRRRDRHPSTSRCRCRPASSREAPAPAAETSAWRRRRTAAWRAARSCARAASGGGRRERDHSASARASCFACPRGARPTLPRGCAACGPSPDPRCCCDSKREGARVAIPTVPDKKNANALQARIGRSG